MRLVDSWNRTAADPHAAPQVPDVMKLNADDPSSLGYRYIPSADTNEPPHHVLLIPLYEIEDRTHLTSGSDLIDTLRNAVSEAAQSFPEFNVGLTGRNVLDADEDRTTDRDGRKSEIVALIVVFIGLAVFLRSIWLAVVAEFSLAVAIGWTFGWATISVGELNLLSTVFLIALIGIGMDYLLQILAAYRREARRYVRPAAIWMRVFRYVGPPVNTACMGAAGAFLVSALTDFKGASELGIIAGGGLLLCLLSAHTVLPAMLVLFPAKLEPKDSADRYGEAPHRTRIRLILPALWALLLLLGLPFISRNAFNSNLIDLQAPNLESVKLIRKLQTWEAVVLSKDLDVLRKVRDAVETLPTVAGTDSVLTPVDNAKYLRSVSNQLKVNWASPAPIAPGDLPRLALRVNNLAEKFSPTTRPSSEPASQPTTVPVEAAALADALRTFARQITSGDSPAVATALSAWQTQFVAELQNLLKITQPPPLDIDKIPDLFRSHLVARLPDGSSEYALYIEPKNDLWNRANLDAFEQEVEARVASVPGAPSVTGISSDIYHTTGAIEQAFYKATAYALILIFILVLIDLRNITHTFIAISVLALGLPMLLALMGLFGITWNFANFFGLPILIGAGHEYGVFMMHRYREAVENPRRVWRRWDPSDRALLLCAYVTCSSFAFFWFFASHKGLRSLGLVMALGTFCIYLATICVVRPLLTWRLESRRMSSTDMVEQHV